MASLSIFTSLSPYLAVHLLKPPWHISNLFSTPPPPPVFFVVWRLCMQPLVTTFYFYFFYKASLFASHTRTSVPAYSHCIMQFREYLEKAVWWSYWKGSLLETLFDLLRGPINQGYAYPVLGVKVSFTGDEVFPAFILACPHGHMQRSAVQLVGRIA